MIQKLLFEFKSFEEIGKRSLESIFFFSAKNGDFQHNIVLQRGRVERYELFKTFPWWLIFSLLARQL